MTLVYTPSKHCDTIPITDTQRIADAAQLSHETILRHVRNHPEEFPQYGKYRLSDSEMYHLTGEPYLLLNEAQAASLFKHLRHTEANQALETELQRQFRGVRFELYQRRQRRAQCITSRQQCIKLERRNAVSNAYDMKYRELAYQMAFGKRMKEYRRELGIFHGRRTIDYMSASDLAELTKAQERIAELLRVGKDYEQIVAVVLPQSERIEPERVQSERLEFTHCSETTEKTVRRTLKGLLAELLRALLQYEDCA